MPIGENIKKYRKRKGLTQKELGAVLGLAEITIRQYENNMRKPKYEILFSIADVLNVSIADLMSIDTAF
jgi:transcriptional regulator with XRE-family HTH domain